MSLQRIIPEQVWEHLYFRGIFRLLRSVYDYTLGWSPIPVIYLILGFLCVRTYFWIMQRDKGHWFRISRLLGGVGAIITLFYWLWGFNYGQLDFSQRIGLSSMQMTVADMETEFQRATAALNAEALKLPDKYQDDDMLKGFPVYDYQVREELESALTELALPVTGRVRVRQLWPAGFLMRWSTAGIYIPHTGEGHIDRGLLSVQKPFTMAHEMAHGYGVTDEGACNFIAWLACTRSDDPWVRFSGAMSYWRFTASGMPDSAVVTALENLPPVVHRSIQLVRENNQKYPDILPQIRNAVYASYLKRHGVESGLRSYHEVVIMVHHYLRSRSIRSHPE